MSPGRSPGDLSMYIHRARPGLRRARLSGAEPFGIQAGPVLVLHECISPEGYSSFSLSILKYCSKKDLIKREQYYIDTLNPDYNIFLTAGSSRGKRSFPRHPPPGGGGT